LNWETGQKQASGKTQSGLADEPYEGAEMPQGFSNIRKACKCTCDKNQKLMSFRLFSIPILTLILSSMHTSLDHEKLDVYQLSLEFITWTLPLLEKLPSSASVRGQLDRASTSIPLNIAEGNGKFTSADRCRFFDNARGSALECAACLDVTVAKRFVEAPEIMTGKATMLQVVSMLFGLIRANSDVRTFEQPPEYASKKQSEAE
jgi:four helix bundle protein